jgi:isopentenyl-diphosphate delta-isomerase
LKQVDVSGRVLEARGTLARAMSDVPAPIGDRKADHLTLCAEEDVGFRARTTLLEQVRLVHDALPDMALGDVDTSVTLFGKTLRAPLLIASMTGGTDEAGRINRELAGIAEERGYGFSSHRPRWCSATWAWCRRAR